VTTTLYHEFEAAFEYEETADQLKAIADISRDLESTRPMDRLVCGDVGYGKTEVAMRAAFKAVEHDRQVAVLVPTTLLAHQHYENFAERFAPFPMRVALLSRFQSSRDTKAILKDVAAGTVDVVIGTHRLLQKDVTFRHLGLVIIDEEQWFGVKHKERLKQLRTQVDVLTLTATPIPRTLQMAMSSVRDLSIIDTPPAGRLAIKTEVVRFSDKAVRDAVLRELGRGGQVYFVHNRVETMERIGAWLHQLIPEARMVMAHGQMDAKPLEAVMLKFVKREADILIASAIIQSGLDVPTANTIIVNRADLFGLAQLYQLRGRVGRGGDQAYAYFLIPDEGTLTGDAQKRLIAIQQFTELGSGFRIAAADMEIRGAGNLLGKQQSGHIAAIGLDLYMQMVEQAVQRLKGHVIEEEPDPTLQLPVSAFIPEPYVTDPHHRLSLYKRLTACTQVGELALLHGEIQDRYGPAPEPVERLLEVMQLRTHAKRLRLASLDVHGQSVTIVFQPKATIPEPAVHRLMDQLKKRLKFLSPVSFEISMRQSDWPSLFSELNAILQSLDLCDTKTIRTDATGS
jgi:transcription-repair coupling factor (superfamily II helicase)